MSLVYAWNPTRSILSLNPTKKQVAMRRADGAFSYEEGIAAVRDMSASPVVRSLPVPLMERRALLAGTEEGRGSVRGATGVQKQRKRGQHKESGTRGGSKGTSSSSSVRHPLCKQIDVRERQRAQFGVCCTSHRVICHLVEVIKNKLCRIDKSEAISWLSYLVEVARTNILGLENA